MPELFKQKPGDWYDCKTVPLTITNSSVGGGSGWFQFLYLKRLAWKTTIPSLGVNVNLIVTGLSKYYNILDPFLYFGFEIFRTTIIAKCFRAEFNFQKDYLNSYSLNYSILICS